MELARDSEGAPILSRPEAVDPKVPHSSEEISARYAKSNIVRNVQEQVPIELPMPYRQGGRKQDRFKARQQKRERAEELKEKQKEDTSEIDNSLA